MKIKLLIILLFIFELVSFAYSQTKKAEKLTEFGFIQCGELTAQIDGSFQHFQREKNAKFYIVYYEGKQFESSSFNEKTNKYDIKLTNPVRGYALNRAKEVVLYLNTAYKPKAEQIALIDGGFREEFTIELWQATQNAAPPKLIPTIFEKDIKFREGKPRKVRNCARAYDFYH